MVFFEKIENLQKKPEHYRRRVLAVSLIAIMSAVVFVWGFSLRATLSSSNEEEQKVIAEYSPFKVLKESVASSASQIKNSYEGIMERFKEGGE